MRTFGVKQLVNEVLESLPKPHTEDAIEDVFLSIEGTPARHERYDNLVSELGKNVVNTWGGFWIAHIEGRHGVDQQPSRSRLIKSYSKLTRPGKKPTRRRMTEAEAAKLMSEYYYAHRQALPKAIEEKRDIIIELVMEGFDVEEAFTIAASESGFAS